MSETELIRLVIWDLDETFWRGTLTEGNAWEYIQDHHEIVIELAKRGIVSAICSKNDYAVVEKILKEYNIWDYFIFPSINWLPKGPRLKELIEDIQLRPETVLFIDDNPSNRAEAIACMPRLQVSDESIIPTLLTHELCQGKEDLELTRLKQYQLLQRRKIDKKAVGINNIDFLRSSNIRVVIEPNISAHLDRAVELINRTNQLNFTKIRLSDDKEAARNELMRLTSNYYHQAGLIRVLDNYGDYGFCGFYLMRSMHDERELKHFCFSCRILGMDVERWLFQQLGQPQIKIEGEVQSDLMFNENIDWINQEMYGRLIFSEDNSDFNPAKKAMQFMIPEIRLRGGCELDALSHYLQQETSKLTAYTNYPKGAFLMRLDNTTNISLSLSSLNDKIKEELNALTLNENDFHNEMFSLPSPDKSLFVISAWGDIYLPVYRHNTLGFEITMALWSPGLVDLTRVTPEQFEQYFASNAEFFTEERKAQIKQVSKHLTAHYTFIGLSQENSLRTNWKKIFESVPKNCTLSVILPSCHRGNSSPLAVMYHAIVRDVARDFSNVFIVDISQFIHRSEDVQDAIDHFDRMIYFNLYKMVRRMYLQQYNTQTVQTENQYGN